MINLLVRNCILQDKDDKETEFECGPMAQQ